MNNLAIYEYLRQNDNSAIFNNTLPPILSSTTTIVTEDADTAEEDEEMLTALIDGSITEITTNAEIIAQGAFEYRRNLRRVELTSVTEINDNAFSHCTRLNTLIIRSASVPRLAYSIPGGTDIVNVFNGTDIEEPGYGNIYVPDELVDAYKNAPGWRGIFEVTRIPIRNGIKAISELPTE